MDLLAEYNKLLKNDPEFEAYASEQLEYYSESDLEDMYYDLLNETYEPIKFGYLSYEPAEVLKSVDKIAYREGVLDFIDSMDLVNLGDGYHVREYDLELVVQSYLNLLEDMKRPTGVE